MSKLRSIDTCIWSDPWFEGLNAQEKLLFIYLITNEKTNMLGVYEASDRKISFETGIELEVVQEILRSFIQKRKVKREGDFLIMINFLKHQRFNTNMKKSAIDVYNNLPEELKIAGNQLNKDQYKKDWVILCKAFGNHKQTLSKVEVEVEDEIEEEIELNASPQKQFSDFSKDSYFSVDRLAEVYLEDEKLLELVAKNTGKPVETLKASMPDYIEKLKTENRGTETPGEFAKYFRNIHKGNFQINPSPKNQSDKNQGEYCWTWYGADKKYGTKEQYEFAKKTWDQPGFQFKTIKSPEYAQ